MLTPALLLAFVSRFFHRTAHSQLTTAAESLVPAGDPGPPGADTSGTVVEGAAIGWSILGFAHAPLATTARASAQLVALKPTEMRFEEACTLPTTWNTVHKAVEGMHMQHGARSLLPHTCLFSALSSTVHAQAATTRA